MLHHVMKRQEEVMKKRDDVVLSHKLNINIDNRADQ